MKFMNMIERVLGDNEGYSPVSKKLRNSFIERLNEMFGDNKGYSPFTKKYYFEYVK